MPSRTHIAELIKRSYKSCKSKVIRFLKSEVGAVCFKADLWTSKATDGYISGSAIFISSGWQIVSVCLGGVEFNERHTGVNIASAVQSMICEYNISQAAAVALVHDQASNMTVAGRELENSLPNFSSVVCAAHRIQNSLKQGLQIRIGSKLLAKARKLVAHFKQSVRVRTALHQRQVEMKMKKLNVVQDVSTSWNSSLYMLRRLLLLRVPITAIMNDSSATKAADQALNFTPSQYHLAEKLVEILEPFESATTLLSAEKKVTLSLVSPMMFCLLGKVQPDEDDTQTILQFKSEIAADLGKGFQLKPFTPTWNRWHLLLIHNLHDYPSWR